MGYKIAEAASKRGHIVTLISGPTSLMPPKVKRFIPIETAGALSKTLKKEIKTADCLIMCAAVCDFRPRHLAAKKIKRQRDLLLKLMPNKDILKELSIYKKDRLFVGFSLETEGLLRNSLRKLSSKHLDLIVANKLTKRCNPFGRNKLDVMVVDKSTHRTYITNKSKIYITHVLLDKIEEMWYLKNNRGTRMDRVRP